MPTSPQNNRYERYFGNVIPISRQEKYINSHRLYCCEKNFNEISFILDRLLERKSTRYKDIKTLSYSKDSWKIDFIVKLAQATLLYDELYEFLNNIKIKKTFKKPDELFSYLVIASRNCPFEPLWHVQYRHDNKRLPNFGKYKYWSYLANLYTNPKESLKYIPDWVKQCNYPRYSECIDKAISEAHIYLKTIYGSDFDTSPRMSEKIKEEYKPLFSGDNFEKMIEIFNE